MTMRFTNPLDSPWRIVRLLAKYPQATELLSTIHPNAGPLTKETLCDLWEFFHRHTNHRPSPDMWAALADLAQCLEDMANNQCKPKYHLSSLDPGVGKTKTIVTFTKALLRSPIHDDVSMVIFLGRLDEIDKLVAEMDLGKQDVAVLTSNEEKNSLGNDNPNTARVLFTTQQMLVSRGDGKDFKDIEEFQYQGHIREVKIWDETILPAREITISKGKLTKIAGHIEESDHQELGGLLTKCSVEIGEVEDGSQYTFPDFASLHGVDANSLHGILEDAPQDMRKCASDLWFLSAQSVRVRKDGEKQGNTLVDYAETFPDDLMPLAILDASGRTRATYALWFEGFRENLVLLKTAVKSYAHLNLSVWRRGGGKGAFKKHFSTLIEGIAETILREPDRQWLICHHKDKGRVKVEKALRKYLDGQMALDNLHFLSYGNHMATNEFSKIDRVILAGTLFYPASVIESRARLAYGLEPTSDMDKDDLKRVELGESTHLILQALSRGAVRNCQTDGTCSPCDVYIIASNRSGIYGALPGLFPDSTVEEWRPVTKELTGRKKEVADYLVWCFKDNPDKPYVSFRDVCAALYMTSSNLTQLRSDPEFQEWLDESQFIVGGSHRSTAPLDASRKYGFWHYDRLPM